MQFPVTAQPDYPDNRDWIYQPMLAELRPKLESADNLQILNQYSEGACTGFALTAAINLMSERTGSDFRASSRMLYEMAKRHDEWEGEGYEGSSLRGAIHGWKNMGVCSEPTWPYYVDSQRRGDLTIYAAKEARSKTIGAYYRIRPQITDYHAALNESGVIVVSAKVHSGWNKPTNGIIEFYQKLTGAHAFAVVGYNPKGFIVQNSWGTSWGDQGLALWSYEDWIAHVMDAWVFQLALPTPQIFGIQPKYSLMVGAAQQSTTERAQKSTTRRDQIAGHFVHIDDGKFAERDRYWSTAFDVNQTASLVRDSDKYDHLLIYGHGGLNSPRDSAARIVAMKEVFKANRIYPYHVMYDTGLVEELRDLLFGKGNKANERVGGVTDWLDKMTETLVRRPGTLIWEEMKKDAQDAFASDGAGTQTLKIFINRFREIPVKSRKKIHLVGHSTGAVLFGHLLHALSRYRLVIESCSLLAPACNIDLYKKAYLPILKDKKTVKLKNLDVYNLYDKLEQDDIVLSKTLYRKSLLYLVSNAFERDKEKPLLGMEKFEDDVEIIKNQPVINYSNGTTSKKTRSRSHGGFDNDPLTMNSILKRILGNPPKVPFTDQDLKF